MNDMIEYLSEQVHNAWWDEKEKQGFHAPHECIVWQAHERGCGKCHPEMIPYTLLSENVKEYDRVTVRTVLTALGKVGKAE